MEMILVLISGARSELGGLRAVVCLCGLFFFSLLLLMVSLYRRVTFSSQTSANVPVTPSFVCIFNSNV